jgi:DNA-binding Lrp family transcriptional regulator
MAQESNDALPAVDEIDRDMLRVLAADSRVSLRELGALVGISRSSAYNRFERLQKSGVIRAFTVDVDHGKTGRSLAAYVHLRVQQRAWRTVSEALAAMRDVEHVSLVSGEVDIVLLVRTADVQSLRDFVLDRLQAMPEVLATSTLFVLDEALMLHH